MKFILPVILILINQLAFSQNVLNYYKEIVKAKEYFSENDLESSIDSYKKAFNQYERPFARDCYNAVEISVLAKDTVNMEYFLEQAILRGITLNDFKTTNLISEYQNEQFYKKISLKEDSLLNKYNSSINWDIRNELNEMFIEDQKIRTTYYNANLFSKRKIGKAWEKLNAKQVLRLIEITKEYGFPGEHLIGLDRNEFHPKIETKRYSAGLPIIILIHHYSQPNPSYDELLFNEVLKGNLYNEHFATICDFEAEFGKNQYPSFGYYGLIHKPNRMNNASINAKRKKIGIAQIDQMKKLNRTKSIKKFWNYLY